MDPEQSPCLSNSLKERALEQLWPQKSPVLKGKEKYYTLWTAGADISHLLLKGCMA